MGFYVTSVVSTMDDCMGLGAKISNSEIRDTDNAGGDGCRIYTDAT